MIIGYLGTWTLGARSTKGRLLASGPGFGTAVRVLWVWVWMVWGV